MKFLKSRESKYRAVIWSSVFCSLAGVFIGAYITRPIDGQRGGAVAVGLAFWVLFVRNDYGARVQKAISEEPAVQRMIRAHGQPGRAGETVSTPTEELKTQVIAIIARLDTDDASQGSQNIAMTFASCFGTFIWGFGDLIACWLRCHFR